MNKYLVLIAILIISLTACTPYKVAIEQGNIMKPEMIKQLEIGMSKSQVEFIMGSPLIKDTFNGDRWDYFYNLRLHTQPLRQKNLILIFKSDHLESITGSALEHLDEEQADEEPPLQPL